MPTREELIEVCQRDAPDPLCEHYHGGHFCVLDIGHDGPHAYDNKPSFSWGGVPMLTVTPGSSFNECTVTAAESSRVADPPIGATTSQDADTTGMVLFCGRCKNELKLKISMALTETGLWCETCCYPPSKSDIYLARPRPKYIKPKTSFL